MIYEFGTEQVNQKLCEKEESGYQSNVTERNMVVTVKFQKKKRCEVCSNSLCDKTHITGDFCLMVVCFFYRISTFKNHKYTYNPIILDGNWIFPFSQLTLGIYFHL